MQYPYNKPEELVEALEDVVLYFEADKRTKVAEYKGFIPAADILMNLVAEEPMNSKERVKRAVKMQEPDRVPLLFAYSLQESDVINVEVVRHFTRDNRDRSEWGFEWARSDESLVMGQVK